MQTACVGAADFVDATFSVDMSSLYDEFLPLLKPGASILDAGCGSGRDSKAFKDLGFRVTAFDASSEMVRLARPSPVFLCLEELFFHQFSISSLISSLFRPELLPGHQHNRILPDNEMTWRAL